MLISVGTAFTSVICLCAQIPDAPPRLGTLSYVSEGIKTTYIRLLLALKPISDCEMSTASYTHPAEKGDISIIL